MRYSIALALVTTTLTPLSALASPFGIEKGEKIEQLGTVKQVKDSVYQITPPRPYPSFDIYSVEATPEAGVCRIVASTPLIQRDAYGQQVRQTFGSIRTQLDQNYGRSDLHDTFETGSIWKTSRDWTMSVWQNERFYAATWEGKSGAKLKDGVTDIMLIVTATSSDASMVSVVYELDNFTACQAEEKRAGRGAL